MMTDESTYQMVFVSVLMKDVTHSLVFVKSGFFDSHVVGGIIFCKSEKGWLEYYLAVSNFGLFFRSR